MDRTVEVHTRSVVVLSPRLSVRSLVPSGLPGTGPSVDREGYTVFAPPAGVLVSGMFSDEKVRLTLSRM